MRRLRRSKGYAERTILEGPHLLEEALAGGVRLERVLATPDFLAGPDGRRLASLLPQPPLEIEPRRLEELADADSPRGVVALARLARPGTEAIPVVAGAVYLYADTVQDPSNLGALARVGEATGIAALLLSPGCSHPNHPRALRASAGSLLRLPVHVGVSPEAAGEALASVEVTPVLLAPGGGEPLWETELDGTLLLLLGGERGVSPAVEAVARRRVTIPSGGRLESLNLAVAAAVVLFELRRRRGP